MSVTGERLLIESRGVVDLRLLELLGATTKDGKSTIGLFGTGAKYAIALALRRGIDLHVFAGGRHLQFMQKKEKIRGEEFGRIVFVSGSKTYRTSMTTGMGNQEWTTDWQVFREFVSNAMDEKDFRLARVGEGHAETLMEGKNGHTRIYLTMTDELSDILGNLQQYVRPGGAVESSPLGSILPSIGSKCRVYKKGIFVRELDAPGLFDYDLADLRLTESRSADTWNVQWEIRRLLSSLSVETRGRVLQGLDQATREKRRVVEADMTFSDWDDADKKKWAEAFNSQYGDQGVLCVDSEVVTESVSSLGHTPVTLPEKVAHVLRHGNLVKTEKAVVGAGAAEGFVYRDPTEFEAKVISKAREMTTLVLGEFVEKVHFRLFKNEGKHKNNPSRVVEEEDKSLSLLLNESVVASGLRMTVESAYGELLGLLVGRGDVSSALRKSATKALFESILPKTGVIV